MLSSLAVMCLLLYGQGGRMTTRWTAPPRQCPWYTSLAFKRQGQMDDVTLGAATCSCVRLRRDRGAGCGCWAACLVALALLFAVCVCLLCSACIAARCFCVTAGQGATSNAIALGVALRRRLCLAFPHPAAHGLLSLISLLRAFLLNVIKRNQA